MSLSKFKKGENECSCLTVLLLGQISRIGNNELHFCSGWACTLRKLFLSRPDLQNEICGMKSQNARVKLICPGLKVSLCVHSANRVGTEVLVFCFLQIRLKRRLTSFYKPALQTTESISIIKIAPVANDHGSAV